MKKVLILTFMIMTFVFISVGVFAEEETATIVSATKDWTDYILDYVPVAVEGIVGFFSVYAGHIIVNKKLKITIDETNKAKIDYKKGLDNTMELVKTISELSISFMEMQKSQDSVLEYLRGLGEALKAFANNNSDMVVSGQAKAVFKALGGE